MSKSWDLEKCFKINDSWLNDKVDFVFDNVNMWFDVGRAKTYPLLSAREVFGYYKTGDMACSKLRFIESHVVINEDEYKIEIEITGPYPSVKLDYHFSNVYGEGSYIVNDGFEIAKALFNGSQNTIIELFHQKKWAIDLSCQKEFVELFQGKIFEFFLLKDRELLYDVKTALKDQVQNADRIIIILVNKGKEFTIKYNWNIENVEVQPVNNKRIDEINARKIAIFVRDYIEKNLPFETQNRVW